MKRAILGAAAGLLCFAGPALAGFTFDLSNTSWDCVTAEKHTISRFGSTLDVNFGVTITINGDGTWTLDHPDWGTYTGLWEPVGGAGFVATLDPSSQAALQSFMEGEVMAATGASAVTVLEITSGAKGKVKPDGTTFIAKFKAKIKGTATISGVERKGVAKIKAIAVGVQL